MAIANSQTAVEVSTTVGEISGMLAKRGATRMLSEFDGGVQVGLSFTIATPHGPTDFQLPVRIEQVQKALKADRLAPRFLTREHAARVAWRIARDWIRSQLAIIDADMASIEEVMLPYALVAPNVTVYDQYLETRKAITR